MAAFGRHGDEALLPHPTAMAIPPKSQASTGFMMEPLPRVPWDPEWATPFTGNVMLAVHEECGADEVRSARVPAIRDLLALVVAGAVASCASRAAGGPLRTVTRAWTWSTPGCIAYSPQQRSYACLGLRSEAASEGELGTFEDGVTTTRSLDIVTVGGADDEELVLATNEASERHRVVTFPAARARLDELGFVSPVLLQTSLTIGKWVPVGRVYLRYDAHEHEGEVSYGWIGTLDARCRVDEPPHVIAAHLRGAVAAAFTTAGASTTAILISEDGVGEDTVIRRWSAFVVDEQSVCRLP